MVETIFPKVRRSGVNSDALFAAQKQWREATENGLDPDAALKTALEWMPLMFEAITSLRR